ncbi:hypothetical protein [Methanobrevibacter sp.]|uniref:hypothetical protein n=1 Tax=Methanobrevibacter sp. TaxID=66852 RepID=UPI00388F004F
MDKGILDYALNHKYTLAFAAGFATAVIGVMLLKSDAVKEITDKGLDTVMTAKNDIEETFQDVNDDAEDIIIDVNAKTKRIIDITDDE